MTEQEETFIFVRMNKLSIEDRTRMVAALVEGNSMRAVSRMTGVARNTINKLLIDLGLACSAYQDIAFRNLNCQRIQADEIWSFVGAKEKNTSDAKKVEGWGDVWTWVAMDADRKLVPCWFVGTRDASAAYHFMNDLADRLANRIQLTADGHRVYAQAVRGASANEIDFAQLVKIYGNAQQGPETRYSPAVCMAAKKAFIGGQPDHKHISTSHVERQNLTMRMSMRRFTRLTNGFSKKVENHEHMLALHYMYYNFGRVHQSLETQTPAMATGVSDHVWTLAEIISLLD